MEFSNDSESDDPGRNILKTKKRPITGRISDVSRKMKVKGYTTGENCKCKRFACFDIISLEERNQLISKFNEYNSFNDQNSYLSGLISVVPVQRRRNRKAENEARFNDSSYAYRVRVIRNEKAIEIPVCYKAFLSLHGVTNRRIQSIKKSLLNIGTFKPDQRGKHTNRPSKISLETTNCVISFLKSLKGRKAHYSLKVSSKIYLSEDLNIKKLHNMYASKHPRNLISYEKFREIFSTKFNISFGYPRSDTCSTCDKFKVDEQKLQGDLAVPANKEEAVNKIKKEIRHVQLNMKLHKLRADTFYKRKRQARKKTKKDTTIEAITMDFQKNLPLPNISTNDIYYRRQLSFYSFNVHILSDQRSFFYTYNETVAKKGSEEVCSMLYHFTTNFLSSSVQHLIIFCDSCAGQNKNYTVFRFLHYLTAGLKRFKTIEVYFPVRGHSYLECDRNMGLINQKAVAETPDDWNNIIRNSRKNPSPFIVIDCKQEMFKRWDEYLSSFYKKTCPFPSRPVKVFRVTQEHCSLVEHKDSYNGLFKKSALRKDRKPYKTTGHQYLPNSYSRPLPLSAPKLNDIKHLVQFCSVSSRKFFDDLVSSPKTRCEDPEELIPLYDLETTAAEDDPGDLIPLAELSRKIQNRGYE